MNYIEAVYKKQIFYNIDNGYLVGLFKVIDSDIKSLINKTITVTGTFSDIFKEDNLVINGNIDNHPRYGEQFVASNYSKKLPESENGIISFLSSDLFPGIGETKAEKIYDRFKDETLDIINNNPLELLRIKGITKKNVDTLHTKLLEYNDNAYILVKLNKLGFSNKEGVYLYKKFKNSILDIVENNIYNLVGEGETLYFNKIDNLALKMGYDLLDQRRVKSMILYIIKEINNNIGDTYVSYYDINSNLFKLLGYEIDDDYFDNMLVELEKEKKIIEKNNNYYLKSMYDSETNIGKRLVYLNNKKDSKISNLDKLIERQEELNNIVYDIEQNSAIKDALLKNFTVITGGPGTGKTTIIEAIISIYEEIYHISKYEFEEHIALLAPTGRASKRIMESVNRPASTIHRFLKWNKESNTFSVNEHNKSSVTLVVIDEISMVDTELFSSLLNGLKYDTKVIIVGDYNQLPSVGSGEILKDIIESRYFNIIELKKIYRQRENSNILNLSHDINNGIIKLDYFNETNDLTFINCNSNNLIDKLIEIVSDYKDLEYNKVQVMAPMYKTRNGIDNLNSIMQDILNKGKKTKNEILIGDTIFRENDKVIELINMPEENIYNGDIGLIKSIDLKNKEIYIDFDNNLVKFTKANFKNFKLGYSISIHKSQGSEFDVVIIPILNEYGRMLYRKLIYTGVTRAKHNLFILGEIDALQFSIKNNQLLERKTGLINIFNEMYEERVI